MGVGGGGGGSGYAGPDNVTEAVLKGERVRCPLKSCADLVAALFERLLKEPSVSVLGSARPTRVSLQEVAWSPCR